MAKDPAQNSRRQDGERSEEQQKGPDHELLAQMLEGMRIEQQEGDC